MPAKHFDKLIDDICKSCSDLSYGDKQVLAKYVHDRILRIRK